MGGFVAGQCDHLRDGTTTLTSFLEALLEERIERLNVAPEAKVTVLILRDL